MLGSSVAPDKLTRSLTRTHTHALPHHMRNTDTLYTRPTCTHQGVQVVGDAKKTATAVLCSGSAVRTKSNKIDAQALARMFM